MAECGAYSGTELEQAESCCLENDDHEEVSIFDLPLITPHTVLI